MYNLNINKSSVVPTNLIVGRVLDKPFDVFQFKIFNGLDPLDLTSSTIEFRGVTPDNKKVISTDIKIIDAKSGEIEFKIPSNFYSASGKFRNAYFKITKLGQTESTNDLLINVLNAVDLNLEDSQIIIDQLDKIIEDAIAKLDKELANVKLQISQVDGNIKALKKDVEDYKATFKVQMDAMQQQLDNLAKAINQTDIQRPRITNTDGTFYKQISNEDESTLKQLRELGKGLFYISLQNASDIPETRLVGIFHGNGRDNYGNATQGQFTGTSLTTGSVYSYTFDTGTSNRGWKRLDGQVHKLTGDDGLHIAVLNDKNKTTEELLLKLGKGDYFISISQTIDIPELSIRGFYMSNTSGSAGNFIGSSDITGNAYSYSTSTSIGWKRLDGQVAKITQDDGKSKDVWTGSFNLWEKIRTLGSGFHTVYATNTNNQLPLNDDRYMMVVQIHEMDKVSGAITYGRITAYSTFDGSTYVQTIRDNGLKGWVRLDNVLPPIATQTQNGLLSSTDKKSLDSLNYTSKVAFTPSSPATLSNYSNLPNIIERNGEFVTIRVALTGVTRGGITVGTIPTEFRPSSVIFKVCPTNSNKVIGVLVRENGIVEYGLTPDGIADLTSDDVVHLTFTYKI